jgi:ComF family protein
VANEKNPVNPVILSKKMNLFHRFLDIIYPPRCPVCGVFLGSSPGPGSMAFCDTCLAGLTEIISPLCSLCGRPLSSGEADRVCETCLRKRPFYDRARAPFLYEGPLMEAIHQFKYSGKTSLAGTLGPLLASFAKKWLHSLENPLVMPVPLHPRRLRERGFNQGLLLARPVAAAMGAELDYLSLRRTKDTLPQTGLKSDERRRNVRKAFEITDKGAAKSRTVILVDDVATTGNTLNECARALKRAGAKEVYGLVLARTAVA